MNISKLQGIVLVIYCVLLGAKIPAMASHDNSTSIYAGIICGFVAILVMLTASAVVEPATGFEKAISKKRLLLMRFGTVAIGIGASSFIVYLYLGIEWFSTIARYSNFTGLFALAAASAVKAKK